MCLLKKISRELHTFFKISVQFGENQVICLQMEVHQPDVRHDRHARCSLAGLLAGPHIAQEATC